jgi:hypothetical protein
VTNDAGKTDLMTRDQRQALVLMHPSWLINGQLLV